jgi:CMP-N-acetylneuraminic acid synthetase/spore coat polysaccharide biosynthesis predicted glycosyltransferase SpsG
MSLQDLKILVVIPARGGSKGIPRKNLRSLNGKPLISYSIEMALESKFKPDVYVSTDDPEIAYISKKFGADIFMRDPSLAGDDITLDSVIFEAFDKLSSLNNTKYDLIITVQPTSPLLKTISLDTGIECISGHPDIDTLISATDDTHLTWKKKKNAFVPNYEKRLNRQFLDPVFKETGGFLITRNTVIAPTHRIGKNVELYILHSGEEVDIDNYEDWNICEYLLKRKTILFIVTGYPEVGLGHAYRTLQMANDILDHRLIFLTDAKSSLAYLLIKSKNYDVHAQVEKDILIDIDKFKPDVIINDILDTDASYMKSLKSKYECVINFEDLGEGAKLADIVINALYPDNYVGSNHYFGQNYFISRDEFRLSPFKTIQKKVSTVLLTFGGTDPCNLTHKVTRSIYTFCIENGIDVNIVTGPGYTNYESLSEFEKLRIHKNISNISEYMFLADIIFSSAGRTVYEIACLGTPSIILAQNKREQSHFFATPENGFINLGLGKNVSNDHILKTFKDLIVSFEARKEMNMKMLEKNVRNGKNNVMKLFKNVISK